MGLYLCVLDENEEEFEGVEVGNYSDFDEFRAAVARHATPPVRRRLLARRSRSPFPVLMEHSTYDGEWSVSEAPLLLRELAAIEDEFVDLRPRPFEPGSWQEHVAVEFDLVPSNLAESFIDVNGQTLLAGLRRLAVASIEHRLPIRFQ